MSFQTFVTQQLASINAAINAITTNGKKIDELPPQTTLNPNSRIHASIDGVSQRLDISQIIQAATNGNYNQLLSIGNITVVSGEIKVPAGATWVIDNVNYTTSSETSIPISLADTGMNRIDILVANNLGQIVLINGIETSSIAVRPNIPPDNVLVTQVNVSDSDIGSPTDPFIGVQFQTKLEKSEVEITDTGVLTEVNVGFENSAFRFVGAITEIHSFSFEPEFLVYNGKEVVFKNFQSIPFTIKHLSVSGTGTHQFYNPTETDLIVQPGEIVIYSISDNSNRLELININRVYNDRFKGKYTSLVNLQSAHPTSNDGDSAIVDAGAGTNALEYIWDSEEGWVQGNSVGATTTDALAEGSTNLYFTTARVLATVLTGISFATGGAIVSTDTVLQAFGKIQKQITDLSALLGNATETVAGIVSTGTQTFGGNKTIVGESSTTGSALTIQNLSHNNIIQFLNNRTAYVDDSFIFHLFRSSSLEANSPRLRWSGSNISGNKDFYADQGGFKMNGSLAISGVLSGITDINFLNGNGLKSTNSRYVLKVNEMVAAPDGGGTRYGRLTIGETDISIVTGGLDFGNIFALGLVINSLVGSQTTSSPTGKIGTYQNQTLHASKNNDVLIGHLLKPIYTDNGYTGLTKIAHGIEATTGFGYYQIGNIINYYEGVVGIGTKTPHSSAKLEVESTTQGTIPHPKMTQAQRTAISSPGTGLHVYQTDGTEGVYVYKSTGWQFAY